VQTRTEGNQKGEHSQTGKPERHVQKVGGDRTRIEKKKKQRGGIGGGREV